MCASGSECQQPEPRFHGLRVPNGLSFPFPLFSIQDLNMSAQPHTVTKVEIPGHVLYTVGTCVLIIGSIGIIGNLLVLYAFYRYRNSFRGWSEWPWASPVPMCRFLHCFPLGLNLMGTNVGGKREEGKSTHMETHPYASLTTSVQIPDVLKNQMKWENNTLFYKQFPVESLKNGLILLMIETTVSQLQTSSLTL